MSVTFCDGNFVSYRSRLRVHIIIMEICKAPTLRLKALNKYSIAHIMYRETIVQELCESRGGRPGLSVLTNLLVSVDVKQY